MFDNKIKEQLKKEIKIINYLNKYNEQSKATKIHQYFIYNHILFLKEEKEINKDIVILDKESKKRGNNEKLRIRIKKATKVQWLKDSKVIMTEKEFIRLAKELKLNKGETCEYISCKNLGIEYKRDNLRYDKGGDISTANEEIQVKFQNATIASLSTIEKLSK